MVIVQRDSGFNNNDMLNSAINEIRSEGARIIIGPLSNQSFSEVKKFNDLTFISPSNINPEFTNNIISVGVSLESQLIALSKFIKKQKKTKTVVMFPNNDYAKLIEKKLSLLELDKIKILNIALTLKYLQEKLKFLQIMIKEKKI